MCEGQKHQCVNACSAESKKAMYRAFRIKAAEEKRRTKVARSDDSADTGGRSNLGNPGSAPVKRQDDTGGPKTWLLAQSPLWACLDRKRWIWATIKGRTRHTDRTSKDEGVCTSDANTAGKKFRIESVVKRYSPPPQDNSIKGAIKSIKPRDLMKLFIPGQNCIGRAGSLKGTVKLPTTSDAQAGQLVNLALGVCRQLNKISLGNSKRKFLGWTQIKLDGKLVQVCEKWEDKSLNPSSPAMGCFHRFLGDDKNRETLFKYTGKRPDNKFGPAGSVSILHSCANRKNWASYGRDATSEEVAFCKTRNTVQHGKPYFIEARQLNLRDGNQWIKMTIGWQQLAVLNMDTNTRIKRTVMTYRCGNKSFARMRKNPRDTSVACIQDMLGLIKANRVNLDAPSQNLAVRIENLGGYGRTRAEEKRSLPL